MKIKLKPKEIWLITISLCILALYFFTQKVSVANYEKINSLKNEIEGQKIQYQAAYSKLRALQGAEGSASVNMERIIKNQDELAIEVISYLSENISNLGLDLVSMKPEYTERTVKQAKAMNFDLIIEGSYNGIYNLLKALEKSPNLLTVDSFKMTRKNGNTVTSSIKVAAYY